ncbi:MAG: glutamate-5-semialdehyde dehydrogenase [Hespellia sp.]|nr:glutamate-5-semialdehyde dehydrogenase [Hespellia sp.]
MGEYMEIIGRRAKEASKRLARLGQEEKKRGLLIVAEELRRKTDYILQENHRDVEAAKERGMKRSLIDRLELNEQRINDMAVGLEQIAALEDPVGDVLSMKTRPNGLQIGKKRVPLGVVGIIYESRPNVTADAFGLCFKTGNATILRGGSDAIFSNKAIVSVIKESLCKRKIPQDSVILVEDTSREMVRDMMQLREYIDVLIPRGGAGLIANVVENSSVPVIETGTGNCHIYVDEYANLNMAAEIIENAKTQRMGVCNACESLVIHSAVAEQAIPLILARLKEHRVEIRGDERACGYTSEIVPATEEDWGKEYLDAVISMKIVDSMQEAIEHINRYNTGHSEAIITENYRNALRFQEEVDAAAVYVNASTRFTDGFEFGFGAEIGISTQKLHARGPMGLEALTTTKYIIFGNGQIRM